jgi:hypothetical protein
MSDAEIIWRRESVADNSPQAPLDRDTRRALAEARLRALAFALTPEQPSIKGAVPIEESDLLAYLLDDLTPDRLDELERALRGDATSLDRLMNLYGALTCASDSRDQNSVESLVGKVVRHKAGEIEIRRTGNVLQFRNAELPEGGAAPLHGDYEPESSHLSLSSAVSSERLSRKPFPKESAILDSRLALLILAKNLHRVGHEFAAGIRMLDRAQSLLQRFRRRYDASSSDAEQTERTVIGLLREVKERADRVGEQLSSAVRSMPSGVEERQQPPSADFFSSALLEGPAYEGPAYFAGHDDLTRTTWSESLALDAGPWSLRFAGVARPLPRLRITIDNAPNVHRSPPLLTVVRPRRGFETATIVSPGEAEVTLPRGESVLLAQGDEVWEIRLRFPAG